MRRIDFKNPIMYGYGAGILAIIFYSIFNILSQSAKEMYVGEKIIFATAFILVKEIVTITMYFVFGKSPIKRYFDLIETVRKFKRETVLASIGGVFGGFVGFVLITTAVLYLKSGIASPFYSAEIIIVVIAVRFLFNRRPSATQMLAISVIAFSLILMPVLDIIFYGKNRSDNIIIGVPLMITGVGAWAVESVIFDKISEREGIRITSLIGIKQISSLLFGLMVAPLIGIFWTHSSGTSGIDIANVDSTFDAMGIILTSWKMLLITIVAGCILYLGRIFFYISNREIGSTSSNAVYNLLFIVQLPISFIASAIDPSFDYIGTIHHEYFWAISVILIAGIFLLMHSQYKSENKL